MITPRKVEKDEPEPYIEPNPAENVWPEDWTPAQKRNWEQFGSKVYNELNTDLGRYYLT